MVSGREALGQSEPFLDFQERLSRVAPVERPVMLIGERGTGKELAASRLHYLSKRWQGPFVTLNCAALASSLIESELFGFEKGAFTGAVARKTGRFEAADGGTLFLDELGSIPLIVQEKILRVVEYGTFERVGGSRPVEVEVRIVGATNENLADKARQNTFKRDLLDRLSFEVLFLPPLRCRGEDIMLLARHFAERIAYELGRDEMVVFTENGVNSLMRYRWPGNVRELKNVVERAVYRSETGIIDHVVFDPFISPFAPAGETDGQVKADNAGPAAGTVNRSLQAAVEELEVAMIRKALQQHQYNQKKAAAALSLTYDQLRGRLRKYGASI
jgi:psp operon transcriptional activator